MKASLAVAAARNAIGQRTIDGTILHSDRGSQFRSNTFLRVLKNVLDRQRWATREELRLAIVVWIERTYHRKRRQRRLGKLTPIEFETINVALTAA
jgi:transposase InsO family protein